MAIPSEYSRLPVTEIVCGIRFTQVPSSLPLLLELREEFKPEFTDVEQHPLLAPAEFVTSQMGMVIPPIPRTWFVHRDKQWVIQVQHDAFLVNWRAADSSGSVPHFSDVARHFQDRLSQFQTFLSDHDIKEPHPTQWELSYIIHIPREHGWQIKEQVGDVFPDFGWRDREGKHPLEVTGFNWFTQFIYPHVEGYMTARIASATNKDTREPLFRFEVNAVDVLSAKPALRVGS